MHAIFFKTPRLTFRRFELADHEALSIIAAKPEVIKYVGEGEPASSEEALRWITNSRNNIEKYGYGTGAVILNETSELIGWAGMARPQSGGEEIIYGLDQAHWGKGLGTELLEALIRWVKDELKLSELRATAHAQNKVSIRMLLKQGFILVDDCYEGCPDEHLYILTF